MVNRGRWVQLIDHPRIQRRSLLPPSHPSPRLYWVFLRVGKRWSLIWCYFIISWSLIHFCHAYKSCIGFTSLAYVEAGKVIYIFKPITQSLPFGHHLDHSFVLVPISCNLVNRAWLQHFCASLRAVHKLPQCSCS